METTHATVTECPKCHCPDNREDANYCRNCGSALVQDSLDHGTRGLITPDK